MKMRMMMQEIVKLFLKNLCYILYASAFHIIYIVSHSILERISGRDSGSDEISKAMKEYKTSLNILLDAIMEWETRITSGKVF